jgi:hypothetical protein
MVFNLSFFQRKADGIYQHVNKSMKNQVAKWSRVILREILNRKLMELAPKHKV